MAFPELLLRPSVSLCLVACVLGLFYALKKVLFHPLGDLGWVGRRPGEWFANSRARKRAMVDPGSMHKEGYSKYSKNDTPFYFPTQDDCDTVILPQSKIDWLAKQPEQVVSSSYAMRQILQTDFLFDPHALHHPLQNFATRVLLTRKLPRMIPVMVQAISEAFDELLGTDTEQWKEVHIVDVMRAISGRTVNRVFIGEPLCHDNDYLDNLLHIDVESAIAGAKLRKIPKIIRPLLGPYVTREFRKGMRKAFDVVNPIIDKRKQDIAKRGKAQLEKDMEEPEDLLQFLIQQSMASDNNIDPTPDMISLRLTLMNFASMQNLSKACSNTILDLVNAPPEMDVVGALRDEVATVTSQVPGPLGKEQLGKMEKLDSVIKESMRVSHVFTVGIQRMVRAPEGVPIAEGRTVPKGTLVGASAISVHLDDDYYPDAREWKPFRFYDDSHRPAAKVALNGSADTDSNDSKRARAEIMRQKQNALTYTSDEYLTWGHGTHACPGRFFSAALLKALIVVLLQEYDLRPQTKRSENVWVAGAFVPSADATVEVRKKRKQQKDGGPAN